MRFKIKYSFNVQLIICVFKRFFQLNILVTTYRNNNITTVWKYTTKTIFNKCSTETKKLCTYLICFLLVIERRCYQSCKFKKFKCINTQYIIDLIPYTTRIVKIVLLVRSGRVSVRIVIVIIWNAAVFFDIRCRFSVVWKNWKNKRNHQF